eukprot:IDg22477t1
MFRRLVRTQATVDHLFDLAMSEYKLYLLLPRVEVRIIKLFYANTCGDAIMPATKQMGFELLLDTDFEFAVRASLLAVNGLSLLRLVSTTVQVVFA